MSQRVYIQQAVVSMAEEMCREMNTDHLRNFSFFDEPVTVERQRAYLEKQITSPNDDLFAVMLGWRIVGTCGLHEIDWSNRNARLGVMLFTNEHRGQGIGSAAMRLVIEEGFKLRKLEKIYVKVFAENTASATKYAHLGFQFEARLRKHYHLRGEYHDMVVMSVFADEWTG